MFLRTLLLLLPLGLGCVHGLGVLLPGFALGLLLLALCGRNVTARCVRFQCPRGRRGSKEGVSRPSDDKTLFLGKIRACSSPGRRSCSRKARVAVAPSVHLGVPHAQSVTPGPGLSIRQQLGWKKVHHTANVYGGRLWDPVQGGD